MHKHRIRRVMRTLGERNMSQALVTDPLSIFYLTGYLTFPHERLFALLLERDERGIHTTLFVNALFPDAEGHADSICILTDTDDAIGALASAVDARRTLGVDANLPARWLVPIISGETAIKVELCSFAVDDARSLKDEAERSLMRKASRINDEAMGWLGEALRVGVTERDVAQGLLQAYRALGADGFSFDPIISFGATAADPHHEPDATPLTAGDMVLFDVGCTFEHYCSDMTRTFFTARPTKRQLEVFDAVRRANEAAEAIVAPGVSFADIDRAARATIEQAGFGPYFTHRTGHQIGLAVHEPGDVSSANRAAVRPGNVFSIEPGIYLPGEIGVRIEDLVLVTEDGCEILNAYPKEPRVLSL